MLRRYTCDGCRREFTTDQPEDVVLDEARALFVGEEISRESCGVLCDDCYQKFLTWFHSLGPEERAFKEANDLPERES